MNNYNPEDYVVINAETLPEMLKKYLSPWQQEFVPSPSYDFLCEVYLRYYNFRGSDFSGITEELRLAYENFNHLCDSSPERKLKYEKTLESKNRNETLKNLYKKEMLRAME